MPAFRDLIGKKFGKWTVLKWIKKEYSEQFWLCRCSCGNEKIIIGNTLKTGRSKSCGCSGKDWCRTHGKEGTKIYNTWAAMRQRCRNPKSKLYPNYGGRGVSVCKRWDKFESFYKDMGDAPKGCSLDRKNNDGDYKKSNCRWATAKVQSRNKRTNFYIKYRDQKKTAKEWSEIVGISSHKIIWRIKEGWSVEDALC